MIEITIEPLQPEVIDFVKHNIGVVKSQVNEKPLFYARNACHMNTILLCEDVESANDYHCTIIEGIVICGNGMAFEHCWNVIRDGKNVLHHVDVTMDAIASDAEREMEKKYFAIQELSKEEMVSRIANNQPLFSEKTLQAVNEYYAAHPEKEEEYRRGKEVVDGR